MKTNSFIKCLNLWRATHVIHMTRDKLTLVIMILTEIIRHKNFCLAPGVNILKTCRGEYFLLHGQLTYDWHTWKIIIQTEAWHKKNSALMCQLRISWLQLFTDHNQVPRDIGVGGVSLGRGRGKNFTKFQKQTLAKNNNCWFLSSPNRPWSVLTVNNFSV